MKVFSEYCNFYFLMEECMIVLQGASAGVLIDPINTKAMQMAKQAGQTPFALLKPAKGIPVLVKVMAAPDDKQVFSEWHCLKWQYGQCT